MKALRSTCFGASLGALLLAGAPMQASAGTLPVAPASKVSLDAPVTDVAYRAKARHHRVAKRVNVRRHYTHRRYYRQSAVPAAAFGLFAGALGAAIASNAYDDYDYGYGYYPAYSYGYGYPSYSYGYGYPAYNYGYYPRQRFYGGHRVYGQRFYGGGPRYVRGGFGGPRFVHGGFGGHRGGFVRGGGFGGHRGGVMHVGGGRHR